MSFTWKDRVALPLPGAPDGDSYYDLVDKDGNLKAQDVKLKLKNELAEPGTPVNAANLRTILAAQGTTGGDGEHFTLEAPGFALNDLATVRLKLHTDMEAEATLDVNGTGAKPIYSGEAPAGIGLKAGEICQLSYNATSERWYLLAGSGLLPKFQFPDYTGNYATYGDSAQGYMTLLSSGTFTAISDMVVDVFMVGGGQSGSMGSGSTYSGGGGGGYTRTLRRRSIIKDSAIPVVIGSGGKAPTTGSSSGVVGSSTLFGAESAAGGGVIVSYWLGGLGGSGGGGSGSPTSSTLSYSGGSGGTNGSNGNQGHYAGGDGQGFTTTAFEGDCAPFDTMLYAGGGGGSGSSGGAGGDGGGGRGGSGSNAGQSGLANSGGGGGGCYSNIRTAGNGGSGIVIVRWGYENTVKEAAKTRASTISIPPDSGSSAPANADVDSPIPLHEGETVVISVDAPAHLPTADSEQQVLPTLAFPEADDLAYGDADLDEVRALAKKSGLFRRIKSLFDH